MSGFDCQFTEEEPREYLQCKCLICLLVLCEPYQVTCCGKSFCRGCIEQIEARSQPCPHCKQNFETFRNRGLQQSLSGFKVSCSNKERGCDWQGELGQLDQHFNLNPYECEQLVGCAYTNVNCLYCNQLYLRDEIDWHQTSLCVQRPYACPMCVEYESTYEDVMNIHARVCECRPVECPNSCGATNLQHQHLEEHTSNQCPLSYVECEFSDAGCDAKVYRKDLSSHLSDNIVIHMSLLTAKHLCVRNDNRELETEYRELETENGELKTKNRELKTENGELKTENRELTTDNIKLDTENSKLKDDNSKLVPDNRELKTENIELKTKIREGETEYGKLDTEKRRLETDIREQKNENRELQLQLKDMKSLFSRVPPVDLEFRFFDGVESWLSETIYSRVGVLQLRVRMKQEYCPFYYPSVCYEFERLPSWKWLHITLQRIDVNNDIIQTWEHPVPNSKDSVETTFTLSGRGSFFNHVVVLRVARIEVEN